MTFESRFELFEKGYERGLKGRVESLDIWLKSQGIDSAAFNFESLSQFLPQKARYMVDREKELESIAEFVGFYKRESHALYHLSLIGAFGSGKTHLLNATQTFLEKIKPTIKWRFVDASQFSGQVEEAEEQQVYYQILEELKSQANDVLLLDSCDNDKNIVSSLQQIAKIQKKGVIITSWTPHFWNSLRDNIEDALPVSKEIHIGPLSQDDMASLVSTIMQNVSRGKVKLSKDVLSRIHYHSAGTPRLAILLLVKTFNQAFLEHANQIAPAIVDDAAEVLGLRGIQDKIAKLADHQLLILKHVLLEHDERGIRPSKLVEVLNKDKATVSYHLNTLLTERLLVSEKMGRYSFYRVRPEIEPFIQLRIAQESEYLA